MQQPAEMLLLAAVAALAGWWLTGLYIKSMTASRRLTPTNDRTMHKVPVPAGAGLVIVAVSLVLWAHARGPALEVRQALLLGLFAGLAAVSWLDDRRPLSPAVRLLAQAAAVAVCLAAAAPEARLLPLIPRSVELALLGLAWLWFINLYNFMDGIDGLAAAETIAVALGYLAVAALAGLSTPFAQLALMIAAATAGYLVWNWHPARVFMGDAGSVPLGFMLGWLMIELAYKAHWAAALILPLYFVSDATWTLVKRLWRGQKPWQAHREHFYQRAVLGGASPARVVLNVSAVNVLLIGLAVLSTRQAALAIVGAAGAVAALLIRLERLARRKT
jgi:UDP-N-acetylmuramyl pentapeptide phosphotransferase/UDP-N-acetylglucosamine-1-phosphate transferase